MNDAAQRAAAKQFVKDWQGKGYEKGHSQPFWLSLLNKVYGVENPDQYITFEDQVMLDHTSFIDGFIPATHVLIEQKGINKDLRKAIKQSDGTYLTPFQQAKRYAAELPYTQRPRWIVTCNFKEFHVYDMERPTCDPEIILLENLEKEYYRLQFLVNTQSEHIKKEMEVSLKAGELVGKLYDALLKQYNSPATPQELKSLNMLCVRLVFCLYAEDAGIFGRHGKFHDYLKSFQPKNVRKALIDLFKVLDTKPDDRDPYMDDDLAAFPYVNGGLFSDENIIIPRFTEEIIDLLLDDASEGFDWSDISPTIFGAVFESTLNPETRRSGGMHYTSIENIHKVIDPLFFDALSDELEEIIAIPVERTRNQKLDNFQKKIASLKFLDPACGSGNFLTETYLSLRKLENRIISTKLHDQMVIGDIADFNPIQVSIGQFYGIEINDFAVTVAKTALWIAESQMMKETENIVHMNLDFLPLKSYANIVEGNALRIDWEDVVPKGELNYIMGNPPFVGYSLQSKAQKEDILSIYIDEKGKPYKTAGKIDYVAGWYFKASTFMVGTSIRTAFVSTNSITQGEQVAGVWKPLYDRFGIHIDFAHRTFRWDSEASLLAHVHCIIIGFSIAPNISELKIFDADRVQAVNHINPYLLNAPLIFVESRTTSICPSPLMGSGGKPVEGGHYIFTTQEKKDFLSKEPNAEKFFRRFVGSDDFINGYERWCLWLYGASPKEVNGLPLVKQRIEAVRNYRLGSTKAATRKCADYPMHFMEIKQPTSNFLVVPEVSSERRKYVPIGYAQDDWVCSNKVRYVSNATPYHLGILTSNVHMAWMRAVCGRLETRYSYSINIVYNNFPWPNPTEAQKAKIEQTAQAILDARAKYPDCSLADLYDELTMPPELRKAHQQNDKAVMQAYGFDVKTMTESSCVAELMKMYQELTGKETN
ncbi:MAG: class I SAM-dependent DNA methyltransferase [Ruminococcaceae bacterium]|nr:class I SAM-dependent DNA methyltransferase [Oscillospiraceae bacterium]